MKKLLNIFLITIGLGIFSSVQAVDSLPVPLEPCDDRAVSSLVPELKWSPSGDTRSYGWEIYLLRNGQKYQRLGGGATEGTSAVVRPNMLENNNKYEWRVQPQYDNMNIGGWSAWCNFNTFPPAIVSGSPPEMPPITAPSPIISGGPTINGLNPNSGSSGQLLKITGNNYDCSTFAQSKNKIIFSGDNNQVSTDESPVCKDLYTLQTTVPNFASGVKTINLVVQVGEKKSGPAAFNLTALPSAIPPPPGSSVGSGASLTRDCEGKPLIIKNPSLYQATNTKEWITVGYDGLVPCGKCVVTKTGKVQDIEKTLKAKGSDGTLSGAGQNVPYVSCQFCHFFVMFGGIVNFLLLKIAVPAAILLLVIGGAMFVFAAGNPGTIKKGTDIMKSVAIGLVIMFTAWIVVSAVLTFVGVADWTGLRNGWFGINCPINI